jgi:hypothetical protein
MNFHIKRDSTNFQGVDVSSIIGKEGREERQSLETRMGHVLPPALATDDERPVAVEAASGISRRGSKA